MKKARKKYDVTVMALKSAAEILERAKSKNRKIKKLEITPDGAVYTKFIPDIKDYRLVWIQVSVELRMITSETDSLMLADMTYLAGEEISQLIKSVSPRVKDFLYTQVGISLVRRAA